MPIIDYQSTTLNKKTGNLTFDSAPIIQHGPHGEFSIAELHWEVFNRMETDGTPYITVRASTARTCEKYPLSFEKCGLGTGLISLMPVRYLNF